MQPRRRIPRAQPSFIFHSYEYEKARRGSDVEFGAAAPSCSPVITTHASLKSMTKALKMSSYPPTALLYVVGLFFVLFCFFFSSLARRSRVITDICAVPTELAAKSSASQRCPALLAAIPNTISGSFHRRRGGKHSCSGQFAATPTPPPDAEGDPCVRRPEVEKTVDI